MDGALRGARVLLTRPEPDVRLLAERIRAAGGDASCVPMIRIGPTRDPAALADARARIAEFDWIAVTSRHAAEALFAGLPPPAHGAPRVCAVGASTAAAVRDAGWSPALVAPGRGGADALADELIATGDLAGRRVLYPCSSLARPVLAERLGAAGAELIAVEAYQALPPIELAGSPTDFDVAVFASPSAAHNYSLLPGAAAALADSIVAVAIGPTTATALAALGAGAVVTASEPNNDGLLAAVIAAFEQQGKPRRREP